jgi:protease PrsW
MNPSNPSDPSVSLLDRAKHGDLEAIATLLQEQCASYDMTVKVARNDMYLQVLLEAQTAPPSNLPTQAAIVDWLWQLNLAQIDTIKVYGKATAASIPAWEAEYPAVTGPTSTAAYPSSSVRPSTSVFWQSLRTFRFSTVFPYREVFESGLYSSKAVKGLLFFGLFPVALGYMAEDTDFSQIAWLLGIYYASFWGVFLFNLIQPSGFSWRKALTCILFTTFVGIPMLLFVQRVPPFNLLYAAIGWGLIPRLFGFIFGVGILEETCKALSLYFFLLRPRRLDNPLTAAFYGAMSGLGFAVAEGATYSLGYATTLVRGQMPVESFVLVNTIRFISLPLFHAVLAGIVGYFLGLAAINPSRQMPIICIGIAIAATLHGLYNTFAGGTLGFAVLAFTILLFVVYLRRSQQMITDMQEAEQQYRSTLP